MASLQVWDGVSFADLDTADPRERMSAAQRAGAPAPDASEQTRAAFEAVLTELLKKQGVDVNTPLAKLEVARVWKFVAKHARPMRPRTSYLLHLDAELLNIIIRYIGTPVNPKDAGALSLTCKAINVNKDMCSRLALLKYRSKNILDLFQERIQCTLAK